MFKLLDFPKRDEKCYFCGKGPVKYEIKTLDYRGRRITTYGCNICVLIHSERLLDI